MLYIYTRGKESITFPYLSIIIGTSLFCFCNLPSTIDANDRTTLSREHVTDNIFGDCKADIDHDGYSEDIQFVLTSGTLTKYDVAAGASVEYDFSGDMGLRVKKNGKTISRKYQIIPQNPMRVTLPDSNHQLVCHDLNKDGDIDFPLRADWTNRSDYKIYSVSKNGQFTELPINNKYGYLPMVDDTQALSTQKIFSIDALLQVNNAKFNASQAANSKGYAELPWNPYRWDGKAFTPISTEILGCKTAAYCSRTRQTHENAIPTYLIAPLLQSKISSDTLKGYLDIASRLLIDRLSGGSAIFAYKIISVRLLTTKAANASKNDSFYEDYEHLSPDAFRVEYTYSLFPNSGIENYAQCSAGNGRDPGNGWSDEKSMCAYIDKKDGTFRIVGWGNG